MLGGEHGWRRQLMGLSFTGEVVKTLTGLSLRAGDSNETIVAVKVSDEILQDFGIERAKEVAQRKHGSDQLETDGTIEVRTSDFIA